MKSTKNKPQGGGLPWIPEQGFKLCAWKVRTWAYEYGSDILLKSIVKGIAFLSFVNSLSFH